MAAYFLFSRTVNLTRPADTTAYAVGDAITETVATPYIILVPNLARVENSFLTRAFLTTNRAAHVESLRMFFFSSAPTVPADNAAFAMTTEPQGYIDFTTFATAGAGSTIACAESTFTVPMTLDMNRGTLWGVLTASSIFTPAASQTFNIRFAFEVSNA